MKIEFTEAKGTSIAEVQSDTLVIHTAHEALELLINCSYQGAEKVIIRAENLIPAFFDLNTGIAGEVLQKFSTYRVQLAIVGDFSKYTSKSLRDFIFESNKMGHIYFANSLEEAKEKLSG